MICYRSEHYIMTKFIICLPVKTMYAITKFMICYWSERCMLRPSLWFVTGLRTLCYDQVYDLLLVRTLYVTTKFMIWFFSERHMLRLAIVTYKLTAVFILYYSKFMICYWSQCCMLRPSLWFVTDQNTRLRPNLWFVTGQSTLCYDQVYDL